MGNYEGHKSMTSKERYLKSIEGKESNALKQAKWRNRNRWWLKPYNKILFRLVIFKNRFSLFLQKCRNKQYLKHLL